LEDLSEYCYLDLPTGAFNVYHSSYDENFSNRPLSIAQKFAVVRDTAHLIKMYHLMMMRAFMCSTNDQKLVDDINTSPTYDSTTSLRFIESIDQDQFRQTRKYQQTETTNDYSKYYKFRAAGAGP
jgi:hypothetical protein